MGEENEQDKYAQFDHKMLFGGGPQEDSLTCISIHKHLILHEPIYQLIHVLEMIEK
jgi:hypothetical protein